MKIQEQGRNTEREATRSSFQLPINKYELLVLIDRASTNNTMKLFRSKNKITLLAFANKSAPGFGYTPYLICEEKRRSLGLDDGHHALELLEADHAVAVAVDEAYHVAALGDGGPAGAGAGAEQA